MVYILIYLAITAVVLTAAFWLLEKSPIDPKDLK